MRVASGIRAIPALILCAPNSKISIVRIRGRRNREKRRYMKSGQGITRCAIVDERAVQAQRALTVDDGKCMRSNRDYHTVPHSTPTDLAASERMRAGVGTKMDIGEFRGGSRCGGRPKINSGFGAVEAKGCIDNRLCLCKNQTKTIGKGNPSLRPPHFSQW